MKSKNRAVHKTMAPTHQVCVLVCIAMLAFSIGCGKSGDPKLSKETADSAIAAPHARHHRPDRVSQSHDLISKGSSQKNEELRFPAGPERSRTGGRGTQTVVKLPAEEGAGFGRWHTLNHGYSTPQLPTDSLVLKQLEAIGYLAGSREAPLSLSGVTRWNTALAESGLSLYCSGHGPEAFLIDMDGNVIHSWHLGLWKAWPDYPKDTTDQQPQFWRRVHLFENGDILAIFDGIGIVKIDKDSNLIWKNRNQAHHDLEVADRGEIYVLTRQRRKESWQGSLPDILEDYITILDADGRELKKVSLLKCAERSSNMLALWKAHGKRSADIFHTNTVEVLDGAIAQYAPAFKKGRVLTSIRNLNTIAVVDLEEERMVWVHRGNFEAQHDPKILNNGHLLLFDNGITRGRSRVLEYRLPSLELVWTYQKRSPIPFYSTTCGAAQRLPNGNTLITESDAGRAIEITEDKKTVWEYYNPQRAGKHEQLIATLFELIRIPREFPTTWVRGAAIE